MISREEYILRRKTLAKRLRPGSMAIIPAAEELLRNGDSHYRFRQDSDFYYLTGFNEPEAVLLIMAGEEGESYLFNRSRNPEQEQWTGKRLGQEQAREVLGVQKAFPIESLAKELPSLFADKSAIYYMLAKYPQWDQRFSEVLLQVKKQVRKGVKAPAMFCDLAPLLSEMRLFKSQAEIDLMRKAAAISVEAHRRAMRACAQLKTENQLEAELMHEFLRQGCRSPAYDPIVAGHVNACILHYTDNNKALHPGTLVLIDAGGEYENYAADITRTFPVGGEFSEEQRQIYQLVLKAQKAGINCIKPGLRWNAIQQTMVHIITSGLCELGILSGQVDKLIAAEAYKPFYMHNSGHWLGLDVHDCGAYKIEGEWRSLEPGMVLTVEPGIYINPGMDGVDERWWGIGIRIEDDILVTEKGHDNLTRDLPVDIDAIEALMRE